MGAFDADFDALTQAVEDAFADTVTVRRVVAGAMDTATMRRAATNTDTAVLADRSAVRPNYVTGAGGAVVKVQERTYRIRSSLLNFALEAGHLILDGNDVGGTDDQVRSWPIVNVGTEVMGRVLVATCRRDCIEP